MQQSDQTFYIKNIELFKLKMLNWCDNRFSIFCFLDSCGYKEAGSRFDWILAAGASQNIKFSETNAAREADEFISNNTGWKFGHLNYNLKNQFENIDSRFPDKSGFGPGFLFVPGVIIQCKGNKISIISEQEKAERILVEINSILLTEEIKLSTKKAGEIPSSISKGKYLSIIKKLQQHIQLGDCYEINFCRYHEADHFDADPLSLFTELTKQSPVPFAAFYRKENTYCICASPERFIKKQNNTIFSQPIKGTAKRTADDIKADALQVQKLKESTKNKSENVMVVDLVRNDLSRICMPGSVHVSELYGIYSFANVHHMISTVEGELKKDTSFGDILKATFPMGSMTGAPKKKVMELIDEYEDENRGLFSGSIGYIDPEGNFDFNVVIRSIFYKSKEKKLSFYAGGAITIYSDAEEEWEECELKTAAISKVLGLE